MKRSVSGEVVCNNFHRNHSLRRYVEKEVAQWIKNGRLDTHMRYRALFEVKRDSQTGEEATACMLNVVDGSMGWACQVISRKPKEAFSLCLRRLAPVRV